MKLANCAKAAALLAQYIPDAWMCAEHDIIHFAPSNTELIDTIPKEVIEQLKALGVHYDAQDGFYGHC